jgi:hypothetical protein
MRTLNADPNALSRFRWIIPQFTATSKRKMMNHEIGVPSAKLTGCYGKSPIFKIRKLLPEGTAMCISLLRSCRFRLKLPNLDMMMKNTSSFHGNILGIPKKQINISMENPAFQDGFAGDLSYSATRTWCGAENPSVSSMVFPTKLPFVRHV